MFKNDLLKWICQKAYWRHCPNWKIQTGFRPVCSTGNAYHFPNEMIFTIARVKAIYQIPNIANGSDTSRYDIYTNVSRFIIENMSDH